MKNQKSRSPNYSNRKSGYTSPQGGGSQPAVWTIALMFVLLGGLYLGMSPHLVTAATEAEPSGDLLSEVKETLQVAVMAEPNDGPSFEVSGFELSFQPPDHPGHPPIAELLELEVELTRAEDGYVAPRAGVPVERIHIGMADKLGVKRFYASALLTVARRLVSHMNQLGLIGIYVAVAEDDLEVRVDPVTGAPEYIDLRSARDKKALRAVPMMIWTGVVSEIRTIASGERIPSETRVDHPSHARVKMHSPVQPAEEGDVLRIDLMRKDLLDNYVFRLNRHPGRKVDMAISSAEKPGEVSLDFLVTENKPWMVFFQASNTGTKATKRWRERFGFMHNQITGNDDILAIDYITAGFDKAHSVLASYEAPLGGLEGWRWRAYGTWGEFDASEVGFADEEFHSEEWSLGGEIVKTIYQYRELFVDAYVGVRWRNIMVENKAALTEGESDFFLPALGLRLERMTGTARSYGQVELEWNWPDVAGTSNQDELDGLGRLKTDDDWMAVKWDFYHSFYLEPFLNRSAWENIETPGSSTLAHEMVMMLRGQSALDNRLIAQAVGVVGGLYSVRGYPESLANGDSTLIASAEYKFHLPKSLPIQPMPGKLFERPFRWAPQQFYTRPDWDLIFRGFFDYGLTDVTDKENYEDNHQLMGTGVGVELLFTRNFGIRVDWGFALDDVETNSENVDPGDNRVHIVGTLVF